MKQNPKIPFPCDGELIHQDGDAYTVRHKDGRVAVYQHNSQPSMTHQEFKDEVDINNIMKRYAYTDLPDIPSVVADFSQVTDYHDMLTAVTKARQAFDLLPGHIRQRFGDDPAQLVAFIDDEKNFDEALKLGLVNPKPEPGIDMGMELKKLNETLSAQKS